MPRVQVKISPDFTGAMQKLQQKIKDVDDLTQKINRMSQQMNVVAFPQRNIQQIRQIIPEYRKFNQVIHRLERMFQGVMNRFFSELGSATRQVISGFKVEQFITAPIYRLGGLTLGLAPLALATSTGIFKWLWDKVMWVGDAMIKDRLLALETGATVGGIRAFRVGFSMLPDDPRLISAIGGIRVHQSSRIASVVHWLLGVKRNQDTTDTIVQALVAAQRFMKSQPRNVAMLRAQDLHLTQAIPPEILMQLMNMSTEEVMEAARRYSVYKGRLSQPEEAQNMLVDFILNVKTIWANIQNKLASKLVELGITEALENLSKAALDFIGFALKMPVTQKMIKGFEEDLKWFTDWLGDSKNQKRIGQLVQHMIINFEKGVAILVEAGGDLEKSAQMRHEIIRFEARQGRRERGLPARPGMLSGGRIIGFPVSGTRVTDVTTKTGTRPEPTTTGKPPTAPRTRQPAPGSRTTPPSRRPEPIPGTTTTTPTPSTPPTPTVPAPARPTGPLGPLVRQRGTRPIWTRHPPSDTPTSAPEPPPVPQPSPSSTPSNKPLGPYNRQRGEHSVWTRHPSAASSPSNKPIPSLAQRQIGDPSNRPWTRHLKRFDWNDPANSEELKKAKRDNPGLFWKKQIPIKPEGLEAFEERHPESTNVIRRQRLRLHGGPGEHRPIPFEKGGSMGWQQRKAQDEQLKADIKANESMGKTLGLDDIGRVPPEKSVAWQPVDPVTLKPTGMTALEASRNYQFRTRYMNPWARPRGNPSSSPSNVPLPPRAPTVDVQPPVTTAGVQGMRGTPSGSGVRPLPTAPVPSPTAGVRGLQGGPSGPAAYGPPRGPGAPILDYGQIPRPFMTGKRTPMPLRPLPTNFPGQRAPVTREDLPSIGDVAVRGDPRTAGRPGLPGGPSGPAVERPWGGNIDVRPPVTTAGVQGPIGTPSGPGVGRLHPPQFSIVENDQIPRSFRTGQRTPFTQYRRAPAPAPAPVTPSTPPARPPSAGPFPRPTTPTAPSTSAPEPTPSYKGVGPHHRASNIGFMSPMERNHADNYMDRLAYLEGDFKTKATGSNKGYFQQSDLDAKNAYRLHGITNLNTGNYAQQKEANLSLIRNRSPDAYAAIKRGDFKEADRILSTKGTQKGPWEALYIMNDGSHAGRKFNQNKREEADRIGRGEAPLDKSVQVPSQEGRAPLGSSQRKTGGTASSQAPAQPPGQAPAVSVGAKKAPDGEPPAAFITHFTEGRPELSGVVSGWKSRGGKIGSQYFMDRDGVIHDIQKETGYTGLGQIKDIREPYASQGINNRRVVGMEISARDEDDITDKQIESFKKFYKENYANTRILTHGEVSANRSEQPQEGATVAAIIRAERAGKDANPESIRQLVRELKALSSKQDIPPEKITAAWDRYYDREKIDKTKIDQPLPSTPTQGGPVAWPTPPKAQDVIRTDPDGTQHMDKPPLGVTPGPWGKMKDGATNEWVDVPKNLPQWTDNYSVPKSLQGYPKTASGQPVDKDVLNEAEQIAGTGNVAKVKEYARQQGLNWDDKSCAIFVTAVTRKRGLGDQEPKEGATTTPKTGGPFDTASNWKKVGDHVDSADAQPGDIAVYKKYTYGPNKGKVIQPGATGGHVMIVGKDGLISEGKNKGKVSLFGTDPTETNRYVDPDKLEIRRLRPLAPTDTWEHGKQTKPATPYLNYDQNANPLENLQVDNRSDARASWIKPYGSDVRDTSHLPDPTDPDKKPNTQVEPPSDKQKDKERDADKPKKTQEQDKEKPIKDADKPKQKEDKSDPGSADKTGSGATADAPTAENHPAELDS